MMTFRKPKISDKDSPESFAHLSHFIYLLLFFWPWRVTEVHINSSKSPTTLICEGAKGVHGKLQFSCLVFVPLRGFKQMKERGWGVEPSSKFGLNRFYLWLANSMNCQNRDPKSASPDPRAPSQIRNPNTQHLAWPTNGTTMTLHSTP